MYICFLSLFLVFTMTVSQYTSVSENPFFGLLPWPHNTLCTWKSLLGPYYDCVTIKICFWKSLLVLLLRLCHNPHLSLKVSSWSVAMTVSQTTSVSESRFLVCVKIHICFWKALLVLLLWLCHNPHWSLKVSSWSLATTVPPSTSVSGSLFLPCYCVCVTTHSVSGSLFLPCYYVCVTTHSVSGSLFLPCYYVCVTTHSVSGSLFLLCYKDRVTAHGVFEASSWPVNETV